MLDPALKRIFAHRESIELLVREFAPERAGRIDFSTLDKLSTALVGEALIRRYPDMLWVARTRGGAGRVVILLEFQGRNDPLMALRSAVYGLLTVQELLGRTKPAPSTDSLEVLTLVIYHGRGRWRAPASLGKLLPRWTPGDHRVIFRDPRGGAPGDLVGVVLRFEQDRSVEGTLTALDDLRRIGEETGARFDRFLAECIVAWLTSSGQITKEQMKEATTMAQVATEYERSLEEYGRRWFRKGRREGRVVLLRQQVGRRFGQEVAAQLADVLGDPPHAGRISEAASAVIDCATGEEFLRRVRRA